MPATIISKAELAAIVPPVDDPPIALAKEAIGLLEQRMNDEFKVRPQMGAELEFATQSPHEIKIPIFTYRTIKKPNVNAIPAILRDKVTPPFPHSRTAAYVYREMSHDKDWKKWEVVSSHQPVDNDNNIRPSGGLEIARSVEALQYQLCHPRSGKKNGHRTAAIKHWQTFLAQPDSKIVIQGSVGRHTTCGLHINASLDTGEPVWQYSEDTSLASALEQSRSVFSDSLYLLGVSPEAMKRWELRNSYPITWRVRESCKPSRYIENQLPHADSNSYYVAMLTDVALYLGLREHDRNAAKTIDEYITMADKWKTVYPANRGNDTPDDLKQQFEESNLLRNTLNQLRVGLGDEFFAAIEKFSPGTEQSATAKMHAARGESPHTSERIR